MIQFDTRLNKCKCGHRAELVASAPAYARYDDMGNRVDMWFTDAPEYIVRCSDCHLETDWHNTMESACKSWNENNLSKWCYIWEKE